MKTFATFLAFTFAITSTFGQKNPPRLPKVDENACPFECCQFGEWTAKKPVEVFSAWKEVGRKQIFAIPNGDIVTAKTGIVITFEPGKIRLLKDMRDLGLKAGDVVLTYRSYGEGYVDFWARGRMHNDQIATNNKCSTPAAAGEPFCLVDEGRKEWWVNVLTKSGKSGWVKGNDGFAGTDACE